jgi:hypothetical protein
MHSLVVRRYVCQRCRAVTVVGPRGLVPGHLFGLGTIVVALWLWACEKLPAATVRTLVRPWARSGVGSAERWASLGRWARRLPWPSGWTASCGSARQEAARRVQYALARAPTDGITEASVFLGAVQVG